MYTKLRLQGSTFRTICDERKPNPKLSEVNGNIPLTSMGTGGRPKPLENYKEAKFI